MNTKEQLDAKWKERAEVLKGKARITREEEKRYNELGKEILVLRRLLYPKK